MHKVILVAQIIKVTKTKNTSLIHVLEKMLVKMMFSRTPKALCNLLSMDLMCAFSLIAKLDPVRHTQYKLLVSIQVSCLGL